MMNTKTILHYTSLAGNIQAQGAAVMPYTPRRLLLVGNSSIACTVGAALSSYQWSIQYAETASEAIQQLGTGNYATGIIILDDVDTTLQQKISDLSGYTNVLWLALINHHLLSAPSFRDLILQHCYAYQTFPLDAARTSILLENALAMADISAIPATNSSQLAQHDSVQGMIGESAIMRRLYQTISKVASVDAPVLILGETGTGKELTARAVHDNSPRCQGPFNAINCGALPSSLIQSELFGYEKGAFTGANQGKAGIIESTHSGTLFLDEIGDLSPDLQVNFLRFLENKRVVRLGGVKEVAVDVRVLAATHVNLDKAVDEGRFREDLYHRLNVLQVTPPPLRERPEDIELLATFFFKKFSPEKAAKVRGFSNESLVLMRQYEWPGNVRELVNRVRRAMVMCEQYLITPTDLGLERRQLTFRKTMTLEQARDNTESSVIKAALARNKYKLLHAARDLDISRVTLYRLIEKHNINRHSVVAAGEQEAIHPHRATQEPPQPY